MHGILHARALELYALYYQAYQETTKRNLRLFKFPKKNWLNEKRRKKKATRDSSSEDVRVIERYLDLLRSLTSAVQKVTDTFGKMDSLAIPTGIEENGTLSHLLRHQEICHQMKNGNEEVLKKMENLYRKTSLESKRIIDTNRKYNISCNNEQIKSQTLAVDYVGKEINVKAQWQDGTYVYVNIGCESI